MCVRCFPVLMETQASYLSDIHTMVVSLVSLLFAIANLSNLLMTLCALRALHAGTFFLCGSCPPGAGLEDPILMFAFWFHYAYHRSSFNVGFSAKSPFIRDFLSWGAVGVQTHPLYVYSLNCRLTAILSYSAVVGAHWSSESCLHSWCTSCSFTH